MRIVSSIADINDAIVNHEVIVKIDAPACLVLGKSVKSIAVGTELSLIFITQLHGVIEFI